MRRRNLPTARLTNLSGLALAAVVALSTSGCTAVDGVVTRACDVSRTSINTGFDHLTSTAIPPGSSDPKWVVIADCDGSTAEPRAATAINHATAWAHPAGASQWIGPYAQGTTDPDTWCEGTTSYLYCFCRCQGRQEFQSVGVSGTLRADNEARIELDGVEILPWTADDTFRTEQPVSFQIGSDRIRPGINCLQVDIRNGSGPTGLLVEGEVTRLDCCSGRVSRPQPLPGQADPLSDSNPADLYPANPSRD